MFELIFWSCFIWALFGMSGMLLLDILKHPGYFSGKSDYGMSALHGPFMFIFVVIRMFQ